MCCPVCGGRILPATQGQGHHQQVPSAPLLSDNLPLGTIAELTRNLVDLRAGLSGGDLATGLIPNCDPLRGVRENPRGFPVCILSGHDALHVVPSPGNDGIRTRPQCISFFSYTLVRPSLPRACLCFPRLPAPNPASAKQKACQRHSSAAPLWCYRK